LRVLIIDGYTDEPAGLGVPPYIDVYPRYVAGAVWSIEKGAEIRYTTVDQARRRLDDVLEYASRSDLAVFIGGVVVPGKYISGEPARLEELIRWPALIDGPVKVLGGPVARYGYGVEGGKTAVPPSRFEEYYDLVATGDVEMVVYDLVRERLQVEMVNPRKLREGYELVDEFARRGARIIEQHPNHGWNLVVELETFRGCPRWISGGCSFCIEPHYGRVSMRDVEGILREVEALYLYGARNFRLGRQPDFLSYMAKRVNEDEYPAPSPEGIEALMRGIRLAAPKLELLHIDNVNPGVVAFNEAEARRALKVIVKYHTPGDVAALGVESADPRVIRENNLGVFPEDALKAIEIINEVGSARGENGLPHLLPGINFVLGLKGETKDTYRLNLEFLRTILRRGLMVRRVNLRQVLILPYTRMWAVGDSIITRHKRLFKAFKDRVRREFDRPMLRRIAPRGTILRGLYVETHEGKYSLARQPASYPLLVYVTEKLEVGSKLDVVVMDHGARSVKGVPYPLNVNNASMESLTLVLGSRSLALKVTRLRPFKAREDLARVVGGDKASLFSV